MRQTKACYACKKEKTRDDFRPGAWSSKWGKCLECISQFNQERSKELKTCNSCKDALPLDRFTNSSLHPSGKEQICKRCRKVRRTKNPKTKKNTWVEYQMENINESDY